MNDFTASNGVVVRPQADGGVYIRDDCRANNGRAQALREFFQAEADERLGRWRWPKNPDYVVYPMVDGLHRVLRESTGHSEQRNGMVGYDALGKAACAYFDAHQEPKPWHDAGPAEVWDVDLPSGGMRAVTVYSARHEEPVTVFRDAHTQVEVETDDPTIRDARRIYPEVF